jgi:hypothetical protein
MEDNCDKLMILDILETEMEITYFLLPGVQALFVLFAAVDLFSVRALHYSRHTIHSCITCDCMCMCVCVCIYIIMIL